MSVREDAVINTSLEAVLTHLSVYSILGTETALSVILDSAQHAEVLVDL